MYGTGRTITAINLNHKEDRVLEKTIQTIHLEQEYALKLLSLNHRSVRINYKRFKEHVSKTRSYLEPDEVLKMQNLEERGLLGKRITSLGPNSALTIASAARRLKLGSDRRRPATSFHRRPTTQREGLSESSLTRLGRSTSISALFIDTPFPGGDVPQPSGSVSARDPSPAKPAFGANEGQDTSAEQVEKPIHQKQLLRPMTTAGFARRPPMAPPARLKTAPARTSYTLPNRSSFNSHKPIDAKDERSSPEPARFRPTSLISTASIDSDLNGVDEEEEHRQELIALEKTKMDNIMKKQSNLLEKVDECVARSALASEGMTPSATPITIGPAESAAARRKRREMEIWKDLQKCRYLRIPQDMLDVSGYTTLVADQQKLRDGLKQTTRRPFLSLVTV